MLKAPSPDSGALSSSSTRSPTPIPSRSYPSSLSSERGTSTTIPTHGTASPHTDMHHAMPHAPVVNTAHTPTKATNPIYSFQRPFVNEPTIIHSFVPPSPPSLSSSFSSSPTLSSSSPARNPHASPIQHPHSHPHHRQLFTSSGSFSAPPCSSRVGVGLQAGADSNLSHPVTCHSYSQQHSSPQLYLSAHHQQQKLQGIGQQPLKTTSGSSSVYLPMLSMLAASASASAANHVPSQTQQTQEGSCREDPKAGGADGNEMQCEDDLPSPDYLSLCNNHTSTTDQRRAPHSIVSSSDEEATTKVVDKTIPTISIMDTIPQHQQQPQQHYLTPELIAMENGVDPTRFFLSTATLDNATRSSGDLTRRLDTPLLDLQEQGYATITDSLPSPSSASSPTLLMSGMENRHAELSIVTKGPRSGEGKTAEVAEVEEGPILSPLSAGLDRRYWQLAESVEDIERLQDEIDQATTVFNNSDEDDSSDASSDDEQSLDEEQGEVDNSATSNTGQQRRRVRFMKEIQIIPSSRRSSDDDDDQTLIDDSDEESECSGDDNDANNNRKESTGNIATTTPTADSKPLTLSSEWKALKVVESILALKEEQQKLVVDNKEERNEDDRTLTPVAVTAPDPAPELAPQPATVPLPPSPDPSTVQLPCSPLSTASALPFNSPAATFSTEFLPQSHTPAKATTKQTPPTINTNTTTSKNLTTDNNINSNSSCISPRTLELLSLKSQLCYWTETATLLRDQEQGLTLHIDQLVQVMADVIEKCQHTETELLKEKEVCFLLGQEIEQERELGFASIQEAALSNQEKLVLEGLLQEAYKEIETLRQTCTDQQTKLDRERTLSLQRGQELALAEVQAREREREDKKKQELEQEFQAQRQGHLMEDRREDCWMDAEEEREELQEAENLQRSQPAIEIEQPLDEAEQEGDNINNSSRNLSDQGPLSVVPSHSISSTSLPCRTTRGNNQEACLDFCSYYNYTFSLQSLIKSLILALSSTFVLLCITLLIAGDQHQLHQSFTHIHNTFPSSSLSLSDTIRWPHVREMILWITETVLASVKEVKILPSVVSWEDVVECVVWGRGLRLAGTWS